MWSMFKGWSRVVERQLISRSILPRARISRHLQSLGSNESGRPVAIGHVVVSFAWLVLMLEFGPHSIMLRVQCHVSKKLFTVRKLSVILTVVVSVLIWLWSWLVAVIEVLAHGLLK